MKRVLPLLLLLGVSLAMAQNTAVSSGAWSSCATWGNPAAIYRNTTDTKTINSGVTVTADAVWSTAALALSGSGAVALNSGIFVDFVNDQGADVTCDAVYASLQSAGCASCAAYSSASPNQYVRITETEYNAIKTRLAGVTVVGATDSQFNSNVGVAGGPETVSIAASQAKAPPASYAVAFGISYYYSGTGATGQIKLKYNTTASADSGYADYGGGNFGSFPGTTGKYFFVIRNPSDTTYSGGNSYMAYYVNSTGVVQTHTSDTVWIAYSDSNTLGSTTTGGFSTAFQVIATPVKQW